MIYYLVTFATSIFEAFQNYGMSVTSHYEFASNDVIVTQRTYNTAIINMNKCIFSVIELFNIGTPDSQLYYITTTTVMRH